MSAMKKLNIFFVVLSVLLLVSIFAGSENEGDDAQDITGPQGHSGERVNQEDVAELRLQIDELTAKIGVSNYDILVGIGALHSTVEESNYEILGEALGKFDPNMQRYLAVIPFITGDARTAYARTQNYEPPLNVYSVVSYDWDKTFGDSPHWESSYERRGEDPDAPVFERDGKLDLYIHEYLHHAELKANIDIEKFFQDVQTWYQDPVWGEPSASDNYQKYTVFWNVYGGNGESSNSVPGREEFAFIGENIANDGARRLKELPPNILAYYEGILHEDVLRQAPDG